LFSRSELVDVFSLDGISGGNAVFNPEKLEWFNQQYIVRLAPDELAKRLKPSFQETGLWDEAYLGDRHAWFFDVLELLKPRVKRLGDFAVQGRFLFSDQIDYDPAAVTKHLRGMAEHLAAFDAACTELVTFDAVSIEAALRLVAEVRSVKAASLIHASRVAVSGKTATPGLFDVLTLLGRSRVHKRLADGSRLAAGLDG
jgi:glutamyl-tRNA synthetase